MARKYIEREMPPVKPKEKEGVITQVRTYKLITPLFGGGAETQKPDAVTTVRGSEVRGHLRFWWRATRGGAFDGDLQKMKEAEENIWGSAADEKKPGPSKVKINVKVANRGTDDQPFEVVKNKKNKLITQPRNGSVVPAYVAFPLQPKKEDLKQAGQMTAAVRVGVEFVLEISYPHDLEGDIGPALWAWETFGGIGGRTRRGFGALQLKEKRINGKKVNFSLANSENAEEELRNELSEYVISGKWHESVPHLTAGLNIRIIKTASSLANQAWHDLIAQYQNFRQKRHKRLGKSLWPEANELRRRLGQPINWTPEEVENAELVQKFPRTVFGLPILMHLPHDGDVTFTIQGKPDPKTEKKYERLSSVLILKPMACANEKAVGLALVLDAPMIPPNGLEIKEPMDNHEPMNWQLTKSDVNTNPLSIVVGNETDVIEAFFKKLK